MRDRKVSLIDYIFLLVKWRKLITINFLIVAVLAVGFTLIIPKTFTASTTILSPSDDDLGLGFSSLLASLPIAGLGVAGLSQASYQIVAILNSRTVMEAIANKFNLIERYGADDMEQTIKALRENVTVTINEDLTIVLTVSAATSYLASEEKEDEARKTARDMANAFIQEMDIINKRLKTEEARNQRTFIERRYEENLTDLRNAENELKAFQEEHGVIALPEQTQATIQAAANLQAEITAKEVEVAVMERFVGGTHNTLERSKSQLSALKSKFKEMRNGHSKGSNGSNGKSEIELFLPLNQAPELGLQYVRLFREVTLQQKLLEFILPQYEQAKIQESRDIPTVQVLDPAVLPILRTSPKRGLICIAAGLVSIGLSFLFVLMIEFVGRLKQNDQVQYDKLISAGTAVRQDVRKFLRRN